MGFKENRTVARIVAVAVIAISILLSGGMGLRSQRSATQSVFSNGVYGDGLSIERDLFERSEAAYNLCSIATKYLGSDNAQLVAVKAARDEISAKDSVSQKAVANKKLGETVEDLYTEIESANLSEQDKQFAYRQYKEFISRGDTIGRDEYNIKAEGFNRECSRFPASLIAKLTGVKPLELFKV